MKLFVNIANILIVWLERIVSYFLWAGPLVARIIVGYVFMLTGLSKLNNLPSMIERFANWGIPFPSIMTPVASGIEFFWWNIAHAWSYDTH